MEELKNACLCMPLHACISVSQAWTSFLWCSCERFLYCRRQSPRPRCSSTAGLICLKANRNLCCCAFLLSLFKVSYYSFLRPKCRLRTAPPPSSRIQPRWRIRNSVVAMTWPRIRSSTTRTRNISRFEFLQYFLKASKK